jgi:hypothetical protein
MSLAIDHLGILPRVYNGFIHAPDIYRSCGESDSAGASLLVPVEYRASLLSGLLVGLVHNHEVSLRKLKREFVHPGIDGIERANLDPSVWVS